MRRSVDDGVHPARRTRRTLSSGRHRRLSRHPCHERHGLCHLLACYRRRVGYADAEVREPQLRQVCSGRCSARRRAAAGAERKQGPLQLTCTEGAARGFWMVFGTVLWKVSSKIPASFGELEPSACRPPRRRSDYHVHSGPVVRTNSSNTRKMILRRGCGNPRISPAP
jgi:hypothetical protein